MLFGTTTTRVSHDMLDNGQVSLHAREDAVRFDD